MISHDLVVFEDETNDTDDFDDDDNDDDDDYKLVDDDEKAVQYTHSVPSRVVTPSLSSKGWSAPNRVVTPYLSSKGEKYLAVVNMYQA